MRGHLSCPRICMAAVLGLLLGLLALTIGWVASSRISLLPEDKKPITFRPLEHVLTWTTPSSTVVKVPEPVTMVVVGDIMLDRNVAARSQRANAITYPFEKLPDDWLKQVDYAIANLEGPVTDTRRPPEKTIDFQFDPAFVPILKAQGLDALSQANNHALDQGRMGYEDSVQRLREAGFLVFGDQVHDDEVALATTTIRGIRFAFVGFNTTDNPLDEAAASSTLAKARTLADHVIVYMHWGLEYKDKAPAFIVDQAHWLIDHGADIVIGGHPHWVQGIDKYKGKPIIYSLGNFIFDQDFSLATRQGLAVKLTFEQAHLAIEPIPIQLDLSQPRVLEGEEKQVRLRGLANISMEELREQIANGKIIYKK